MFSKLSGLKQVCWNRSSEKGYCGTQWHQCINLKKDSIKILGIHFSYNKKLEQEKNFEFDISKIVNVLKLWRIRNLAIEGKIIIFKTLAISKLVPLVSVASIPLFTIEQVNIIKKNFMWQGKKLRIKHSTLLDTYELGGFKDTDISLQYSWVRQLFEKNCHEWKIIPL